MIEIFRKFLAGSGLGAILVKALIGSAGLRIVAMFFGFLVGIQLARGLGPAGYGIYGTAMAFIAVLMIPTELGLPMLVTREVATTEARGGGGSVGAIVAWARHWVVLTSVGTAGLIAAVLYFGWLPIDVPTRSTLAYGLLWIPIVAIGNVYAAALRGMHRVISGQIGELVIRPVAISAFLYMVTVGFVGSLTPALAMVLNVMAAALAAAYSWLTLKAFLRYTGGSIRNCDLHIGAALPMGLSEGMRILSGQFGILVLGLSVPQQEVGLYRVAFGIYTVATMPSALLNTVCSPILATLYAQKNRAALIRLNFWIVGLLIAASTAALLLGALFGSDLIGLLFGGEYQPAIVILLVLLAGELIASLFGHPTVVMNMLGEQDAVMWWSGAALALNVVLTLALVPNVGYVGAAIGGAMSQVFWRAGCAAHAKRRLGIDTTPLTSPLRVGRRAEEQWE